MEDQEKIAALYADLSACFLALINALDKKGVLSKAEMTESAQERLLALQPTGKPNPSAPYNLVLLEPLAPHVYKTPS